LLATGKQSRHLTVPLGENGKLGKDRLQIGPDLSVAADRSAELEVFDDREAVANLSPLWNQGSTEPNDVAARDAID
jgi:hypothetical protein